MQDVECEKGVMPQLVIATTLEQSPSSACKISCELKETSYELYGLSYCFRVPQSGPGPTHSKPSYGIERFVRMPRQCITVLLIDSVSS